MFHWVFNSWTFNYFPLANIVSLELKKEHCQKDLVYWKYLEKILNLMKQLLFQILPCVARTGANIHIFRSRNSSHFIKFCPWKEQLLRKTVSFLPQNLPNMKSSVTAPKLTVSSNGFQLPTLLLTSPSFPFTCEIKYWKQF